MNESLNHNKIEEGKESKAEVLLQVKNIEQISTRGDGSVEKGEVFNKEDIDFSTASHLSIHQSGEIAGSQFNNEVFKDGEQLIKQIKELLPEKLQYDQFGRCELTIEINTPDHKPIGWSGVKDLKELENNPDVKIVKQQRIPGGIPSNENGIDGVWYPEMIKNESGSYVVALDESGKIKNEKAKFEPLAQIAFVEQNHFPENSATKKIAVIIEKDIITKKPSVFTIFPGENTPAFPAKINTETYKYDSLSPDSQESKYWETHVFVKILPKEEINNSEDKKEEKLLEKKRIEELRSELKGEKNKESNIEALESEAGLFMQDIEKYVKDHYEYMMGYSFSNIVVENLNKIFEKYNLELDADDIVESIEEPSSGSENDPDDDVTKGSITVSGKEIFKYSSNSDGYGASIDNWNKDNLIDVLKDLIK